MTPKDKAKELINKYKPIVYSIDSFGDYDESIALVNAKSCAFIAVDEMLDFSNRLYLNENSLAHQYLLKVKKEIINL